MLKSKLTLSGAVSILPFMAMGLTPAYAQDAPDDAAQKQLGTVVVTGTRIQRDAEDTVSPVSTTGAEQIALERAVTVENIVSKLPQFAGGVNSTQTGSDGRGATTLDLRSLGQNRTLVLINGTRAVPFSFRNAVDVNAIPAPLLKQVDVLTGGAAAVYGADAVAGVVNFIIDDEFDGVEFRAGYQGADGGAEQYSSSLSFGSEIGDRGHFVGFLEYANREELLAGERSFAVANAGSVAGAGGNYTDVASGNTFSFDDAGNFTLTPQTTSYVDQFLLVHPLERYNASSFFKYSLFDKAEAYGRFMYSNTQTTGAGATGQNPVVISEDVTLSSSNAFLPAEAAALLTFDAAGNALVNVQRSLSELGVIEAETNRDTLQIQGGLRGDLTGHFRYDAYLQYGRVNESTTVLNDALRNNGSGDSRFAAIADSVDLFGPGADLSGFGTSSERDIRERDQFTAALVLSGETTPLFELPAGPISYAVGVEYREEEGSVSSDAAVANGLLFRSGSQAVIEGKFDTTEFYVEGVVPIFKDQPFAKSLTLEGAYRTSDYSNAGEFDTDKLGLNWQVNDDIRFRTSQQTVIRAPNLGEFAAPQASIPFSLLRTIGRLNPRYQGDPCALGRGDAAQCSALGAPAVGSYDSLDPANLTGQYIFGGNPNIQPEEGETFTIGAVLTPSVLPGLDVVVDYYDIEITNAVGVIQPVDALESCYVLNPTPGNPLCDAVSRDPATGFIEDGFVTDFNVANIQQSGVDLGIGYTFDFDGSLAKAITFAYDANFVTDASRQNNPVHDPIDCKGTFGATCSADGVSLVQTDYRHQASVGLDLDQGQVQLAWRRIGSVSDPNDRSIEIDAQDYVDLNASWNTPLENVTLNFGINNLFDQEPPEATGAFNTFPGTYDVVGRTYGLSLIVRH